MPEKLPLGYWDFDEDSTNDANVAAILDAIQRYTDLPTQGVAILRRALAERDARIADLTRRQEAQAAGPGSDKRRVEMPAAERRAYSRDVPLVEYTRVCRHCGRSEVIIVYPTAKPTVCDRGECQRAEEERIKNLNRDRQRRWRESHGGTQQGLKNADPVKAKP